MTLCCDISLIIVIKERLKILLIMTFTYLNG